MCIPGCRRCWTSARTGGAASFSSIAGCSASIHALEPANTSSCGTSAGQVSVSLLNLLWRDQSVFVLNTHQRGLLGLYVPFRLYFLCNTTPWVWSVSPLLLACCLAGMLLLQLRPPCWQPHSQIVFAGASESLCQRWAHAVDSGWAAAAPVCNRSLVHWASGTCPLPACPSEGAGDLCTGKDSRSGAPGRHRRQCHRKLTYPYHAPAFNCAQIRLGNVTFCLARSH